MSQPKYLLTILLAVSSLTAFSQNNGPILLRWKLKPGEQLRYKTSMQPIDTPKGSFSFSGMFKKMGGDSLDKATNAGFKKIVEEAMQENANLVTTINSKGNGIDIEMQKVENPGDSKPDTNKADSSFNMFKALMKKTSGYAVLRGSIYDDGSIKSFYLNGSQKNLIEAIFQLPSKPVKVGDSWALDVNFLSLDQSFICDSSYKKDICTLTKISEINGEHIATIQYDITEYVSGQFLSPFSDKPIVTTMTYRHFGTANFSVEKGRWIDYNCIMSNESSGLMDSNTKNAVVLSAE
jgi:hypothetical protein